MGQRPQGWSTHAVADRPLLHAFSHAGGGPDTFRRWPDAFRACQIVPVRTEGAGTEHSSSVAQLARRWRRRTAQRSGVYYGHSLGALVAFEAAALAIAGRDLSQAPRAVVLGAPPAPGQDLAERLPARARAAVASALDLVRRYQPSRKQLPLPVVVLWGELDQLVREDEARGWVQRGGTGSGWLRVPHAGHLFHLAPHASWVEPLQRVVMAPMPGART
jgi:surfactin synthase thioesterase subunit